MNQSPLSLPRETSDGKQLICQHCGHQGQDVITRPVYLGGSGMVNTVECADTVACWHRWDFQHGLVRR